MEDTKYHGEEFKICYVEDGVLLEASRQIVDYFICILTK